MRPELRRFGNEQLPVVVIDEFSGDTRPIIDIAVALAPYPFPNSYYPGVRRIISTDDVAAYAYVEETCERAAKFIGGAFDVDAFELLQASFSIVSKRPGELTPPQRAPHFDTADHKHLALLHYLRVPPNSGTAFFRQRGTGIERVTETNIEQFVATAKADAASLSANSGYIYGSDQFFEQIGAVDAVPDRLIIYQGSLLHSGIIPQNMNFSADPREGRLTANLFVRGE